MLVADALCWWPMLCAGGRCFVLVADAFCVNIDCSLIYLTSNINMKILKIDTKTNTFNKPLYRTTCIVNNYTATSLNGSYIEQELSQDCTAFPLNALYHGY